MSNHGRSAHVQRAHVHCPITALDFLQLHPDDEDERYILSGEDTHLKIYDAATSRLCASVQVFAAQPVHGINTSGDVLVWGGPWVAVIARAKIESLLEQGRERDGGASPSLTLPQDEVLRAPDWLYHASHSPLTPALGAVVTAHNEVIPLRTRRRPENDGRISCWGKVRAPPSSRPNLYSAQVRWLNHDQVLVAAGTVFGEIVVWRCRIEEDASADDEVDEVEVLYVFTGHEGSIFGVDLSPEIQVGEGRETNIRLLASCSDDRTIRVWDISEGTASTRSLTERERAAGHREKDFPEARETGFGENTPSDLETLASHASTKPLAVAMGHVSRIWNVCFGPVRPSKPTGTLAMYSFGEDATAQRWQLDLGRTGSISLLNGDNEVPIPVATLTHEAIVHRHSGKHIWSSAVTELPDRTGRVLVATGGSDGKINIFEEVVSAEENDRAVMLDISGSEIVNKFSAQEVESRNPNDTPNTEDPTPATKSAKRRKAALEDEPFLMYAILSDGSIIATTPAGRIFRGSLNGPDEKISWAEISLPKLIQNDLQRYQIVRSAGIDTALLGSTTGHVYMYHGDAVRQVYKAPGKVADIFPLPVDGLQGFKSQFGSSPSPLIPIIVSTMGSSQVRLLILDPTSEDTIRQERLIELEKGFIVTAAGCCQGRLIFGSRNGALLVYSPTTETSGGFERIALIDRPFTKDSVACIVSLPPKAGSPSPYFLTTSRDGRYRIYEITTSHTTNEATLHLRHEALPPLGPMIESALFTSLSPNASPELILAGFRSKSFIVWNETRQLELANVECGGGHRSFTYRVLHDDPAAPPARLTFVWTKASRTCVYAQNGLSHTLVKKGGHGREIKAVAACGSYVATGAEDTALRIWRYRSSGSEDDGNGLDCLAVVERHTTGIQCLKWAGENYLLSSSGNEELFIWRITRLAQSAYKGLAVVCEGVYPDKTRDGDLRIMGFDVQKFHVRGGGGPADEEEEEEEEILCLSLVLSNSTLKTYRYSKAAGFALLAEGRYTGACLMQIRHLRVSPTTHEGKYWEVHVLTASTDGHLALWKTSRSPPSSCSPSGPETYVLVQTSRLHQSGIKALDLQPLPMTTPSSSYALLTGGDDNALGHARLEWSPHHDGHFTIPPSSLSLARGAHAAAVTGLCVTGVKAADGGGGYRVVLCTASTDQRIKHWRVDVGGAEEGERVRKVALVGDRYSGVADCGDLERLGGGDEGGALMVVVGVGMEIWRV